MSDARSGMDLGDTSAIISAGCWGNDLLSRYACKADEQATKLLNEATSNERTSKPAAKGVFMIEGGIKDGWIGAYIIQVAKLSMTTEVQNYFF